VADHVKYVYLNHVVCAQVKALFIVHSITLCMR